MSGTNHSFKTSTFGGFNREDVLKYIETIETEHETQLEELREQVEAHVKEKNENNDRIKEKDDAFDEMKERMFDLETQLSTTSSEKNRVTEALQQAQEECIRLRERVKELEPKAHTYEKIKDRTATIELSAHERAEVTMEESKKEAKRLQEECAVWMRELQDGYENLQTRLHQTLGESSKELTTICEMFDRIASDFDLQGEQLKELRSKVQENSNVDGSALSI